MIEMDLIKFLYVIIGGNISSFVTIVAFLIELIGLTQRHKYIEYIILKKEDKLGVAFWNASKNTIRREDILYLNAITNIKAKINKDIYSSDKDIQLDFKEIYELNDLKDLVKKNELSFEFLIPKKGFFFTMDEVDYEMDLNSKIFNGRLIGEDTGYVYKKTKFLQFGDLIYNIPVIKFLFILFLLLEIIQFIFLLITVKSHLGKALEIFFLIFIAYLFIFALIYFVMHLIDYTMPKDISKKIEEYKKQGFKQI